MPSSGLTRSRLARGSFLLLMPVLLFLCVREGLGSEESVNPHAFMGDPEKCTTCHDKAPVLGVDDFTTVTFNDSIMVLCSGCHEDAHLREEHPVEVRPEFEIPTDFHLDSDYTMTCTTCHEPHGDFIARTRFVPPRFWEKVSALIRPPERFRTYFLRRSNTHGEMCLSCHRGGVGVDDVEFSIEVLPQYVGSEKCGECHPDIYREWKKTLHSTNFQDAVAVPGVVRGKFEGGEPFPVEKVLFTVGEHWTQRYIVEGRKGLAVKPESWAIIEEKWTKGGSFSRPWLRYCAGCHVTALNPFDGTHLERGTGCEGCHGPGLLHIDTTDQYDIINPALLVESRRDMICEACHTSGHDRSGIFRYPVGYRPGENLTRYYRGLVPKAGQDKSNFKGDGSYEDRHRQFEYWADRLNILEGLSCDVCTGEAPPPGAEEVPAEFNLTPDQMCGTCHRAENEKFEEHADHRREDAGCLDCHPPMVTVTGEAYSIHDHKFQFGTPPPWMMNVEDPCERCHPPPSPAIEGGLSSR